MTPDTDTLTRPAGSLDVDTAPVVAPAEPGDHERMSHYAIKGKVAASYAIGTPLTALCGKTWVPSRDPKRFPVCKTCQEILDAAFPPPPGDDA